MSKPNNPAAYPLDPSLNPDLERHAGMTLRDWFAGQAIASLAGRMFREEVYESDIARWAYTVADAMLAEREKGNG